MSGPPEPTSLARQAPRPLSIVERLGDAGAAYTRAARAESTVRAYAHDWADFSSWCMREGVGALPVQPADMARYLAELASVRGLKAATIARRIASISQAHKAANLEAPTRSADVRGVWAGIKRVHGTAQEAKAALLIDELREATRPIRRRSSIRGADRSVDLRNLRDRAVLLVGFAGAFRRSELVALELRDLDISRPGAMCTIRHSKTDQERAGRRVAIPWGSSADTCPIKALQAWLKAAEISTGPLFRRVDRHGNVGDRALSGFAVALIVKHRVAVLGLDPDRYAGHSLRAGLATSAANADVPERTIALTTGHKSMEVLRRYIRDADLWKFNAARALGL